MQEKSKGEIGMKKLLLILVLLVFIIIPNLVFSGDITIRDKAVLVHNWLMEGQKDIKDIEMYYSNSTDPFFERIMRQEEDISKFAYKWRWNIHLISIICREIEDGKGKECPFVLYMVVLQYQDLTSIDSQQFVKWHFIDIDVDGIVDDCYRSFHITRTCDKENFYFLVPVYPEWFVNKNTWHPSVEETQTMYEYELDYWINYIEKGKK